MIQVFTDFDGTITTEDSLVFLLDKYVGPAWLEIEERVERGTLCEEEGLRLEISMLEVPWPEARLQLLSHLCVDPHFAEFVRFCRAHSWPLTILSGGLKPILETILKREGLEDLPFFCNDLAFNADRRWRVLPAQTPRIRALCNHCKSWHLSGTNAATIYIGDGTTDRCPAARADLVFARGGLADWCAQENLDHVPAADFRAVIDWLEGGAGRDWVSRNE